MPTQRTPPSLLTQEHALRPEGRGGHLSCLPAQQPGPRPPPSLRTQDQHCYDTLSGAFQHVGGRGAARVSSPPRLGAHGGWGPATASRRSSPGRGWTDSWAAPRPARPLSTGGAGRLLSGPGQAGSPGLPGGKQPGSHVSCSPPQQPRQLDGPCSPARSSQGGSSGWPCSVLPGRASLHLSKFKILPGERKSLPGVEDGGCCLCGPVESPSNLRTAEGQSAEKLPEPAAHNSWPGLLKLPVLPSAIPSPLQDCHLCPSCSSNPNLSTGRKKTRK